MALPKSHCHATAKAANPRDTAMGTRSIKGTVKSSERGYFLCYAHCYDKDGALIRIEKIYQELEENVPFEIWYAIDIPADTVRLVLSADRMD